MKNLSQKEIQDLINHGFATVEGVELEGLLAPSYQELAEASGKLRRASLYLVSKWVGGFAGYGQDDLSAAGMLQGIAYTVGPVRVR